jgi:hypothetical protein
MAAMNKSLARSNKSPHGGQSDKEVARQWLLGRIHNEVEDLSPKLIRKGVGRRRAVNLIDFQCRIPETAALFKD